MGEDLSEACGIFGAISSKKRSVFHEMYWGLLSLNHRGQQSYGFTTWHDGHFIKREDLNLVPTDPREVERLSSSLIGSIGISNARYATSGGTGVRHLQGGKQPIEVSALGRRIALSYNGNIVNAADLRKKLRKKLGRFRTDSDTEVFAKEIVFMLDENSGDYRKAIGKVMDEVEGAYSTMLIDSSDQSMYAFRDTGGIRPYCFGRGKDIVAFASETPALDINSITERDYVNPGELVVVDAKGRIKRENVRKAKPSMCAFEFAYFSRPDSVLNGTNKPVYKIREAFAKALSESHKKKFEKTDLILSMPETADDAAYGLHAYTGIPWERAVRKNRYVTRRAFISGKGERDDVIDKKMNIVSALIKGKRLAVMEDSIVRGDTSKANLAKLNAGGAKSIDVYVTFPRIANPCLYGVDMATYKELLGARMNPDEIAEWLGASSVNYQTIKGLVESIGISQEHLCLACVTGKYPTKMAQDLADKIRKPQGSHPLDDSRRIYERS